MNIIHSLTSLLKDNKFINASRFFLASGLIIATIILGFLWINNPKDLPQETIARQWNRAIQQLGIDPIYPPQEDFMVGDVFLITRDLAEDVEEQNGESALGRRSLKLWRMDLGGELEKIYAKSFTFPKTSPPASDGLIWEHEVTQASIFRREDERKHMPVVVFPELTVATIREGSAGGGLGFEGLGAAFGSVGASDRTTEIRIRGAESYGVPYLVASGALHKFCVDKFFSVYCTDEGARQALSSLLGQSAYELIPDPHDETKKIYRVAVEIMLVSHVYLTRWIETVDREDKRYGAQATIVKDIAEALENLEVVAAEVGTALESTSPRETSETIHDTKVSLQSNINKLQQTLKKMDATKGYSGNVLSANSRGVLVSETLPRPVAIGFQSVRRILSASDEKRGD